MIMALHMLAFNIVPMEGRLIRLFLFVLPKWAGEEKGLKTYLIFFSQ